MIFEPSSDDPTIAWKASAFGMIIESIKIDGSVIPQPNLLANLAVENAHFANSAIPYVDTIVAYIFNTQNHFCYRRRTVDNRHHNRVLAILHNYSYITIPCVRQIGVSMLYNQLFPGFWLNNRVTWLAKVAQFFAFRLNSATNTPDN
jgi:hypothetical protein